ncbi:rRNA biogenesis protein RRP36-like [Amaranthus tricolor]|uniref:rRNA biogenesis protein RRP36-like n=1 Tax=Amaranthus tricolor TaxID=29722 RepID=UPI00258B02E8|nr:rRNA biogenesis protein RRP36-like [Amaranthus tricolor]
MEENQNQNHDENGKLSEIADKLDKTLDLTVESSSSEDEDEDEENGNEDEEEEDDENEEFEFCFVGDLSSPVSAEEVFKDGQIRAVAPYSAENAEEGESSRGPPVKKLFVVSSPENDDVAEGPYCTWKSPVPEMSRKSNSTGFSKLWRVKELLARSNSDGKDSFVFLTGKNDETSSTKKKKKKKEVKMEKKSETTAFGGESKQKKKKKSAYELLYGGKKDKKKVGGKSYLPYRQDLVGFFTNGSSGLSRNVHPY